MNKDDQANDDVMLEDLQKFWSVVSRSRLEPEVHPRCRCVLVSIAEAAETPTADAVERWLQDMQP